MMRFVVFQEDSFWLAQGIEHDICVQARDLGELRQRLVDTIDAERALCGNGTLNHIGPAPGQFQQMWMEKSEFASTLATDNGNDGKVELALCA